MDNELVRSQTPAARRNIVVIGASAGGLEALKTLAAGLPANFPAAILVVIHVPPSGPNFLPHILSSVGPLPATQAEGGEPIRSGHIFVATPDRHLVIDGSHIRLTRAPKENHARPSINVLFRSAAYSLGHRVIGVVLSGMLDDGTSGLWTIKERAGMAMVQAPEEALYPSMPLSAIEHVPIDAILPAAKMPETLMTWVSNEIGFGEEASMPERMEIEHTSSLGKSIDEKEFLALGSLSLLACPECHGTLIRILEGTITRFRCHTGHVYSQKALLSKIDEQIDVSLWNTIRGFEERTMLLHQMADQSQDENDTALLRQQRDETEKQLDMLRSLVTDDNGLGHDGAQSGELET
jgi:two-component system chemotaxis response regulator CheB